MTNRRSFLSFLAVASAAPLALAGCGGPQTPQTVLSEIEAGVADAQAALQVAASVAAAILAANPNPALAAKIDEAETAAQDALRALTDVLAGATSIADANAQAALQAFSDAYGAVMALLATIGVKQSAAAPRGKFRRAVKDAGGKILIAPPTILNLLQAKKGGA